MKLVNIITLVQALIQNEVYAISVIIISMGGKQ